MPPSSPCAVVEGGGQEQSIAVVVLSPQLEREFRYSLHLGTCELVSLHCNDSSSWGNPYVEYAIQYAIALAKLQSQDDQANLLQQLQQGLKVTIFGDNDFYSHQFKMSTADGLSFTMPRFAPVSKRVGIMTPPAAVRVLVPEIKKTGLGSSAAMVTAVVTSILQLLHVVNLADNQIIASGQGSQAGVEVCSGAKGGDICSSIVANDCCIEEDEKLHLIHRIAQAAHCAAQGKVGSGFDVSAAVYGSQRYTRFSPSVLTPLSTGAISAPLQPLALVADMVQACWDEERKPFALPAGLELMLGEIGAGGSSTPSMVGELQKWRKQQPDEAQIIWTELAKANEDVERSLRRLCALSAQDSAQFSGALAECSTLPADKWLALDKPGVSREVLQDLMAGQVATALWETRAAFEYVRSHLKRMGELAGVPIEPDDQTALIEATISINGVLLAGVPGAGGYDAIFAIVLGKDVKKRVAEEWERNKSAIPLPTYQASAGVQVHDGDEEMEGYFN